jgi:hypothetical protein
MHADQPPSRRRHLHHVLADRTPDLSNTPNPAYEFPVEVESHPGTFGRGDISLEDEGRGGTGQLPGLKYLDLAGLRIRSHPFDLYEERMTSACI